MGVHVTDHALVRYLERILGIDMEAHRAEIAALAQPFADLKTKHAPIDGGWLVFEGEKLVTITPTKPDMRNSHRNDRGGRNGSRHPVTPMPWQGMKRRRSHK